MKIYGITVVNSEGYINGKESDTIIGADKEKIINEAYQYYCPQLALVGNICQFLQDGSLNTEEAYHIETDFLYKEDFIKKLEENGLIYIQYPDHHIQFEYFETEI